MTPSAPGVIDEWVAWNVRFHRDDRGMSQADLAEKMAALGWKYHPQTIHRIESGQRKVTVGEAEALARIFGTTVDRLTWPDMMTHTVAWLSLFTDRANMAYGRIVEQAHELLFNRAHLERALAEVAGRGIAAGLDAGEPPETLQQAVADARDVLDGATPERAVQDGREDYDQWRAGAADDTWDVFSAQVRIQDRFPRPVWPEAPGGEGETSGLRPRSLVRREAGQGRRG